MFVEFFKKLRSLSKGWRVNCGLWSHTAWLQILALLLLSFVILSK